MKKQPERLKSTNSSPPAVTTRSNKNNNKKQSNKHFCPFACPNCETLGEYLGSKYGIINVLADTGDSIFSPMHDERYHDDEDHNRSIRNGGKVFLSADLVDSFLQQKVKKSEEEIQTK
jgi:hypothetical protein